MCGAVYVPSCCFGLKRDTAVRGVLFGGGRKKSKTSWWVESLYSTEPRRVDM